MGTYLIIVKADRVVFMGGAGQMREIITLNQSKTEKVIMSPCERYVLTYSPGADVCFTVWNFQMAEIIREFDYFQGETENTYKWSFDGEYLAKQFKNEKEKEDGTVKVKTGISVYKLPIMTLLEDSDGVKKSITVDNIHQWEWVNTRNLLVYISKPEEEQENVDPMIGFITIPTRKTIGVVPLRGATELKMFQHPQGKYMAVQNMYLKQKFPKCAVEVFNLQDALNVPHVPI